MAVRKHTFRLRKAHKRQRLIAGVDEAGRGAWAGPLVAAAVILPFRHSIRGIKDSKKLSPAQRERLYDRITRVAVAWAVHIVQSAQIDRGGIQSANHRALRSAVAKLRPEPHKALIDGFAVKMRIPSLSVIKGDEKHEPIAAASIIAKVTRDRMMVAYHRTFPAYGFDRHKGYGTHQHHEALKRYGVTPHHRSSFAPVRRLVLSA